MFRSNFRFILVLLLCSTAGLTQSVTPTTPSNSSTLPAVSASGGMSLNEALAKRRSVRSFASTPLSPQETSQLLWAAQGITDSQGHRTAPSAHAGYYVRVFLATAKALYRYEPEGHQLRPISDHDVRSTLSSQQSVKEAPAVFVIMSETERAAKAFWANSTRFVYLEVGHVAQNLLLQATSLGLGAVPVGGLDPKAVSQALGNPAGLEAVYLIPVGHPE